MSTLPGVISEEEANKELLYELYGQVGRMDKELRQMKKFCEDFEKRFALMEKGQITINGDCVISTPDVAYLEKKHNPKCYGSFNGTCGHCELKALCEQKTGYPDVEKPKCFGDGCKGVLCKYEMASNCRVEELRRRKEPVWYPLCWHESVVSGPSCKECKFKMGCPNA